MFVLQKSVSSVLTSVKSQAAQFGIAVGITQWPALDSLAAIEES